VTGLPTWRWAAAGLGRTFQNLQVFFNMSALENVMTGATARAAMRCGRRCCTCRRWRAPRRDAVRAPSN
jgi:ABC-type branched-subunit amino acid transport system ATPase component